MPTTGSFPGQVGPPVDPVAAQDLSYPHLLDHRPDPPPTGFETLVRDGQRFNVVMPNGNLHLIDPQNVVPIRDPRTRQLQGYVVREVATQWFLDRDGRILTNEAGESPLGQPVVDPIDLVQIVGGVGSLVGKGVGSLLARAAAREAGRAAGRVAVETAAQEAAVAAGAVGRRQVASQARPIIIRYGQAEADELTSFWRGRLARSQTRPQAERALQVWTDGLRPSWRQSEMEVEHIYETVGGRSQVGEWYIHENGRAYQTFPEVVTSSQRVEVKRWTMELRHEYQWDRADEMMDGLAHQIEARRNILTGQGYEWGRVPAAIEREAVPKEQTLILDLRTQEHLTDTMLHRIANTFSQRTGIPVDRIQILLWDLEYLAGLARRPPGL